MSKSGRYEFGGYNGERCFSNDMIVSPEHLEPTLLLPMQGPILVALSYIPKEVLGVPYKIPTSVQDFSTTHLPYWYLFQAACMQPDVSSWNTRYAPNAIVALSLKARLQRSQPDLPHLRHPEEITQTQVDTIIATTRYYFAGLIEYIRDQMQRYHDVDGIPSSNCPIRTSYLQYLLENDKPPLDEYFTYYLPDPDYTLPQPQGRIPEFFALGYTKWNPDLV